MRGAGWELLDSWILEACGLISRTKPTQWGGADMSTTHPPTPDWNFLPARKEEVVGSRSDSTAIKECSDSLSVRFWPCENISLISFLCCCNPWIHHCPITKQDNATIGIFQRTLTTACTMFLASHRVWARSDYSADYVPVLILSSGDFLEPVGC